MTTGGRIPRLLAAGVFGVAIAVVGLPPTAAQNTDPAVQQKVGQKNPEAKKKRAAKPKARPKVKPAVKQKPKPLPETKLVPPAEPAWGAMPGARPMPLPKQTLSSSEALGRFAQGIKAEQAGDDHAALRAFLDAGEAGHGPSQMKLGEIYDRGNAAVERDYATSLGWYQKARDQGMAVPKPHTFPSGR